MKDNGDFKRLNMDKEFVYEFWSRKGDLGKAMIESNNFTYEDLLFLIPNNMRKVHGLPLTRIRGTRKRIKKHRMKIAILNFKMYDIIEERVNKLIEEKFSNENYFAKFMDFKDKSLGDKIDVD